MCFSAELWLISVHKFGIEWHPQLELELFEGAFNDLGHPSEVLVTSIRVVPRS